MVGEEEGGAVVMVVGGAVVMVVGVASVIISAQLVTLHSCEIAIGTEQKAGVKNILPVNPIGIDPIKVENSMIPISILSNFISVLFL